MRKTSDFNLWPSQSIHTPVHIHSPMQTTNKEHTHTFKYTNSTCYISDQRKGNSLCLAELVLVWSKKGITTPLSGGALMIPGDVNSTSAWVTLPASLQYVALGQGSWSSGGKVRSTLLGISSKQHGSSSSSRFLPQISLAFTSKCAGESLICVLMHTTLKTSVWTGDNSSTPRSEACTPASHCVWHRTACKADSWDARLAASSHLHRSYSFNVRLPVFV